MRILRRGTGSVLNSRSEFNRCKIARLTLEANKGDGDLEQNISMEEDNTDWTATLLNRRDDIDREDRKDLGRVGLCESSKRRGNNQQGRKKKRRNFEIVVEEWGLDEAITHHHLNHIEPTLEAETLTKVGESGRNRKPVRSIREWAKPVPSQTGEEKSKLRSLDLELQIKLILCIIVQQTLEWEVSGGIE